MISLINDIKNSNEALFGQLDPLPVRSPSAQFDWEERLIGVVGAKGVGKTTLLLQRLFLEKEKDDNVIYLSLDHPLVARISIVELAEQFDSIGGRLILLDEVHKYEGWSAHIKAIYDSYKKLRLIFSGSSALHLHQGQADLSRRAVIYQLPILSFREFVHLESKIELEKLSLADLLIGHREIAQKIARKLKPLEHFKNYLEFGAYPFYREGTRSYAQKLIATMNFTLESDLVFIHGIDARYSAKLRGLLGMVATSVPLVPKISSLAAALGLSRPTVSQYLEYLQDGGLIRLVHAKGRGYQKLAKPEKIYLNNSNLSYALGLGQTNIGTVRETFFASQLTEAGHSVEAPEKGDFIIDQRYAFEIGGKRKNFSQIKDTANAFLACDEIEIGQNNRLPLWMFGLLY